MQRISLDALARQQLKRAVDASGGHTADTVYGGREKVLRQTVIGYLIEGATPAEHENPGEATLQPPAAGSGCPAAIWHGKPAPAT